MNTEKNSNRPQTVGFNKNRVVKQNRKPSNERKEVPEPQSAFTPNNKELLNNIITEEDILKTNNKSLGIPAIVWCEYMALLDTTDNDYTYELLEELIHERISRFTYDEKQIYEKNLSRKIENERYKIEKKLDKKRKL